MDYNHIEKFLQKFKKILFSKKEVLNIISDTILKYINIKINTNQISIRNTIVKIESSPIVKNEILLHKKEIISDLNKLITTTKILDIK